MSIDYALVGHAVIDAIVSGSMIRVEVEGDTHIIIWQGNSAEQIGEVIARMMRAERKA